MPEHDSAHGQDHVRFLNSYYSKVYRSYDATRKYFLWGRDALLREISARDPGNVIEIGCGTGRNLAILKRNLPETRFGAVEPCDSMREHASRRHPWIKMSADLVEDVDLRQVFSEAPDVIFFSYALSMIQEKEKAIENCLRALAPQGELYVLDFGNLQGLGRVGRALFKGWLQIFHVFPDQLESIWEKADRVTHGPLSYWQRASFLAR